MDVLKPAVVAVAIFFSLYLVYLRMTKACWNCNERLSKKAATCTNCGRQQERKRRTHSLRRAPEPQGYLPIRRVTRYVLAGLTALVAVLLALSWAVLPTESQQAIVAAVVASLKESASSPGGTSLAPSQSESSAASAPGK